MITEREVQRAIEECMEEPVTGNKRAILADLIIIKGYLFGNPEPEPQASYHHEPYPLEASFDPPPVQSYQEQPENIIETDGGSEFLRALDGKRADRAWKLMDEFVEAVKILHPKMHATFIQKVYDL